MRGRGAHHTPDDDPRRLRAASYAVALEQTSADPIGRRELLARLGAAISLAGLGACTRAPREEIVPYVVQPPEVRPGVASHYATAAVLDGYATGVVVESHVGRPTKVEGNPEHPASLGAAGVFEQASVLSLYDPGRARAVTERGVETTIDRVTRALSEPQTLAEGGRGLHVVLEPTSSPTVAGLLEELRRRLPRASVSFYSAVSRRAVWRGSQIAFGRVLEPRYSLATADVIVSLDADFLSAGPAGLRLAREYADRRVGKAPMSRLYVVEPLYTVTGAAADHRLRARPGDVLAIAAALGVAVGLPALPGGVPAPLADAAAAHRPWIEAVARDLVQHRERSVVIAGDAQPPEVHALAHAINVALGNVGATVTFAPSPILEAGEPSHGLERVAGALAAGEVDTLVVCAENPVYASPASLGLASLASRARQSVYLGAYDDETAAASTYRVARAHSLESWGDARAFDGTLSIVQPLVDPLFGGRTVIDLLALLAGKTGASAHHLVRERFFRDRGLGDDEGAWRAALRRGVVEGSAIATVTPRLDWAALARSLAIARVTRAPASLELTVRADPRVHDGRFASNAWLLELPAPVVKLTWTNAATISVATAAKLGITSGDEVVLRVGERSERAVACVVPGQADGSVGLTIGWGRERGAGLGSRRGTNAFSLAIDASMRPVDVLVDKTGARRDLPITQTYRRLEGRDDDILQHGTPAGWRSRPNQGDGVAPPRSALAPDARPERPVVKRHLSLYEKEPGPSPWQWGMAIDLTRCTGCAACVVACQAENNIPTVGPDNVVLNREMHWLRIDSYLVGDEHDPAIAHQPMLCQHCEMAPCEYVCPVNATVHSPDGLNEMVYNRCVGTRFCSNNCPYKVRRFNWFDFHRAEVSPQELVYNPDVTVRARGVMEKCTFCVQRLREHEIKKRQGRPAPMPQTACQQTCPTRAIVFGDLRDPDGEVKRLHADERAYAALDHLGTEPRVRYLARLRNPNPELT